MVIWVICTKSDSSTFYQKLQLRVNSTKWCVYCECFIIIVWILALTLTGSCDPLKSHQFGHSAYEWMVVALWQTQYCVCTLMLVAPGCRYINVGSTYIRMYINISITQKQISCVCIIVAYIYHACVNKIYSSWKCKMIL